MPIMSHNQSLTIGFQLDRFGTSLMYYGLSLNLGSFGLSIYLTQFIFAVAEFPAYLLNPPLRQHLGKKRSLAGVLFLGGFACFGVLAVPRGKSTI